MVDILYAIDSKLVTPHIYRLDIHLSLYRLPVYKTFRVHHDIPVYMTCQIHAHADRSRSYAVMSSARNTKASTGHFHEMYFMPLGWTTWKIAPPMRSKLPGKIHPSC